MGTTWTVNTVHKKKFDVVNTRMLTWMCGESKLDMIRNGRIRGTREMGGISKKVQERRLIW